MFLYPSVLSDLQADLFLPETMPDSFHHLPYLKCNLHLFHFLHLEDLHPLHRNVTTRRLPHHHNLQSCRKLLFLLHSMEPRLHHTVYLLPVYLQLPPEFYGYISPSFHLMNKNPRVFHSLQFHFLSVHLSDLVHSLYLLHRNLFLHTSNLQNHAQRDLPFPLLPMAMPDCHSSIRRLPLPLSLHTIFPHKLFVLCLRRNHF